ncbi:MAG: hypothetical protein WCP61_08815 [Chitinophagia bacterium]
MSITKITVPNQISSANNQVIYKISSTNTAQPNFNFVADVTVSGYSGIAARLKYPVQPSSTQLQFDIGNVLKNYVSINFVNSIGSDITGAFNTTAQYFVDFREQYDVSGIATITGISTTDPASGYRQAINTVFDFPEFSANILDSYDVSVGAWLTSRVANKWKLGEQKILTFLDKNRTVNAWAIEDSNGGTSSGALSLPTACNVFNIDFVKIESYAPSSGVKWIDFSVLHDTTVKATYRIAIYDECSLYTTYRLHWLNQYCGWDTFNFNKAAQHRSNIERKQFKSILPLGYATSDRLKKNYSTKIVDSINLQSDWISDAESDVIQSLIESPYVFLEDENGNMVSVNVANTSYLNKKFINGRAMFNASIDIEYTYNRNRQSI